MRMLPFQLKYADSFNHQDTKPWSLGVLVVKFAWYVRDVGLAIQCARDRLGAIGVVGGVGAQQAETARQHHIAVRHREVGV